MLSSIGAALWQLSQCDIWAEALIIALVLHFYLRFTRQPRVREEPAPKAPTLKALKAPLATAAAPAAKGQSLLGGEAGEGAKKPRRASAFGVQVQLATKAAGAEAAEVGRFIAGLLRRGGGGAGGGQEALTWYGDLRARQVDLRRCIPDDERARSLYGALIECGVHLAIETGADNARASTSRFLADMRVFGFPRLYGFYAAIMKVHIIARFFVDALWLHDVLVADGLSPSRTMYVCLLSAAVSCGRDQKALALFREILKTGPAPMRTYMTVLRVFVKNQDWSGAVELLQGLKLANSSPDALVLNTVLGLCISAGETRVAVQLLLQWVESADVVSCNIVLKGYAQQANMSEARALLGRMLESGPRPNTISFNTIMDCAVRALQAGSPPAGPEEAAAAARRPWQLLDQLLEVGLEPDRYTCSTLVKGLHVVGCAGQDVDRIIDLLRRLGPAALHGPHSAGAASSYSEGRNEGSNTQLVEVLFNTLLDACASIQSLDRVVAVFAMMAEFQVEASAVTCGTLIKAFGQAGQLQHCHEVWQNMLNARLGPSTVTYGCYIDTCIRHADMETAERVFRSMPGAGVRRNAHIFATMIRGFAHAKWPLKALEIYKEMRREGVEASAGTFNSVLDLLVRQLVEPAHLQEVMDDMSAAPDAMTYSILTKACCNIGQLDMALSLFRQLRARGLVFDEVGFNTLLLACSKVVRVAEAEEILAEMRSMGVAPTHVTTSILVKMYGKAKMLDKAIEVSRMAEEEYGVKPNLHVFTCLIQACVRNSQIRSSWEVFNAMLREGVVPDAITYGSVIHGCVYQNKFEQAMELVRHAYALPAPDGCSPLQSLGFAAAAAAKPPSRGGGAGRAAAAGAETPPSAAEAPQRRRPVPLQPEVLRALLGALRRKGHHAFGAELEGIIARARRNRGVPATQFGEDFGAHNS